MRKIDRNKIIYIGGGLVIVIALIAAVLALKSGSNESPITRSINLQDSKFVPDMISVPKGSDVRLTIKNTDNVEHQFDLPEYGINTFIPSNSAKTVSFKASGNISDVQTCGHGETLSVNVV